MSYFNNNAEGGTPGSTVAASQSGSGDAFGLVNITGTSTAVYSNAVSIHGNQSYQIVASGTDLVQLELDGANDPSAAIRIYVYLNSAPSAPMRTCSMRSSAGTSVGVNITSASLLQLINAPGTSIHNFTLPLDVGVWYRIELGVTVATSTTGSGTCAYYQGDSVTPVETYSFTTENFGTANIIKMQTGKLTAGVASCNYYIDDITLNDGSPSLIGPYPLMVPMPWFGA